MQTKTETAHKLFLPETNTEAKKTSLIPITANDSLQTPRDSEISGNAASHVSGR